MDRTTYTADITATHAVVWAYRQRLAHLWPTPDPQDSLRFAVTEAGEALDASLRQNPAYARNNHRNMSVEDELADCAMMLVTANGADYSYAWLPNLAAPDLDLICLAVAGALITGDTREAITMIAAHLHDYYGVSLTERVTARLQRIERKVTEAAA